MVRLLVSSFLLSAFVRFDLLIIWFGLVISFVLFAYAWVCFDFGLLATELLYCVFRVACW